MALKASTAATFTELPIIFALDHERQKGADESVEAVHQRLKLTSDGPRTATTSSTQSSLPFPCLRVMQQS